MAKRVQWRYTFNVTKRWRSVNDVYADEHFQMSIKREEFNIYEATRKAEAILKTESSNNYVYSVKLDKVEQE